MNRLPAAYPVIRLFVSSTFRDWVHGRDLLQSQVFPSFDAWCHARGARFRPVDLRWGVSEDAALDQQALAICLAEIARCQRSSPRPNFLILLGDRYGWRPLPALMPCDDFEALAPRLEARRERPLLEAWYLLDLNARPPVRLLRSRGDDPGAEPWPTVERELGGALRRTVAALGWPAARRRRYEVSATELEIRAGALEVDDAADHVLCLRRTTRVPTSPEATGFDDADAPAEDRPAIDALRRELERALRHKLGPRFVDFDAGSDGAVPDRASLQALADAVRTGFEGLLVARLQAVTDIDRSLAEARIHAEHAESLARIVIGRAAELRRLRAEAEAPDGAPLVLVGARGSGKSSLLARLVVQWRAERTEPAPVFAFIGLTSASTSGLRLLAALDLALARMTGDALADAAPTLAYDELAQRFEARLEQVASVRRVLLVIDALDQLDAADPARNLTWLPHRLPPGAAVIVSCVPGELHALLERKLPAERFVTLPPLAPAASEQVLEAWLDEDGRTLHGDQAAEARRAVRDSGLPLHMRLVFEEVRRWRSFDGLPPGADGRPGLPDSVQGAVDDLLWRLAQPSQHGERLVERALAYLAAGRNGLTDDEMADLLSRDMEVMDAYRRRSPNSPRVDRLPDIVWLRLFADLEAYVVEREADGAVTLGFFHPAVAQLVEQRFLGDAAVAARRHAHLADYFDAQALHAQRAGRYQANLRKLTELPIQLARARQWERLVAFLVDAEMLGATVRALGPQRAIEHLDLALQAPYALEADTIHALALLQATLRLAGHILARDPDQLRGQLHARLPRPAPPTLAGLLAPVPGDNRPRLCAAEPSFWRVGGPVVASLAAHRAEVTALVLTPDGGTAVSASRDGTVKVWDLARERERYVLALGDDVLSLTLTPDAQGLVAGTAGGVIAVFDLSSGTLLRRWQGDHDCRALVVSPDGHELWCGGTQKVVTAWGLDDGVRRRSMPLPDSGSGWMALSADGRRLMVGGTYDSVAVLDLPEGTLRRQLLHGNDRWVSGIAMTGDGRLGASGDYDGQLLLWDLETGQRLCRLLGHHYNEQVTAVAFTPDGRRLVSASHRGWLHQYELDSPLGDSLQPAVVIGTGGHRIIALAITPDGRRAITAAKDTTLRVWDLDSRQGTGLQPPRDASDDEGDDDAPARAVRFGPWRGDATLRLALDKASNPALHVCRPPAPAGPPANGALAPAGEARPWPRRSRHRDDDDDDPPPPSQLDVTLDGSDAAVRLDQGPIDAAALSADGRRLLCIGCDGGAALWDLRSAERILDLAATPRDEAAPARPRTGAVWLARDTRRAMSLADDGTLHWWLLNDAGGVRVVAGGAQPPLVPAPGGDAVAAFCADGWLRLWALADGAVVARARVAAGAATGFTAAVACWLAPDGTLGRFDLRGRRRLAPMRGIGQAVCIDAASEILLRLQGRDLALHGLRNRRTLAVLPAAGAADCALWLDGGAGLAATVGPDLSLWNLGDATLLDRISGDAPFVACSFESGGRQLRAWLHQGGEHRFEIEGHLPTGRSGRGRGPLGPGYLESPEG